MITLETTDILRIQIDFPERCIPTCDKCGHNMNKVIILTDCLYTQRNEKLRRNKNNESLDIRGYDSEGRMTHVHFQHQHPNSETIKTAYYCPLTQERW